MSERLYPACADCAPIGRGPLCAKHYRMEILSAGLARPKCADIGDVEILMAVLRSISNRRLIDAEMPEMPANLLNAKLRKLERRGLIEPGVSLLSSRLTTKGLAWLDLRAATKTPATFSFDEALRLIQSLPRQKTVRWPLHPSVSPEQARALGFEVYEMRKEKA